MISVDKSLNFSVSLRISASKNIWNFKTQYLAHDMP